MKGFIEVLSSEGNKPMLVAVHAISLVEQYTTIESRIVLNVKLEDTDQNQYIICWEPYVDIKRKIEIATASG